MQTDILINNQQHVGHSDESRTNNKKCKIPPVICKLQYTNVHELMTKMKIKQFSLKVTSIGVIFFVNTQKDYESLLTELKSTKTEFFTYAMEKDRTTRFVLFGLPDIDNNIIENDLKSHDLIPVKIVKVLPKNKRRADDAIYFITFRKNEVSLAKIRECRYIHHTVCKWETANEDKRGPTQCQKCYMYGHGTSNCHMSPRCVHCGLDHSDLMSPECPIKADTEKFKCANCQNNHAANSVICPKREQYIEIKQQLNARNFANRKGNFVNNRFDLIYEYFPPLPQPRTQIHETLIAQPHTHVNHQDTFNHSNPNINPYDRNLFSTTELFQIFNTIISDLSKCETREQQIRVVTEIALKYICN